MARRYGYGSKYDRTRSESPEAKDYNEKQARQKIEQRRLNKRTGSNAKPTAKPTPSTTAKPTPSATGSNAKPPPSATGSGGKPPLRSVANKLTRVAKAPFSMVRKAGAYAIPAMIGGYAGEELKNTPGAVAAQNALGDATNKVQRDLFGGMSNDDLSKSLLSDDPEKNAVAQAEVARLRDDPRFYEPGGALANFVDKYYGSSDDETTFNAGTLNALGDGWDSLVGAIDPATGAPAEGDAGSASALSEAQNSMLQGDYPYIQAGYGDEGPLQKPPKLGFGNTTPVPRAEGENIIRSANGFMQIPPNDPNGSALAARVNTGEPGDAAYALEQGAMANAIRQRSIDENRGSGVTIVEDSGMRRSQDGTSLEDVQSRILKNSQAMNSGVGSTRDLNRLYRENESLEGLARSMTNQEGYAQNAASSAYRTDLGYESDALDRQQSGLETGSLLNFKQIQEDRMLREMELGNEPDPTDVLSLFEGGNPGVPLLESIYAASTNP